MRLDDTGFPVHVGINHNPIALALHSERHPHTGRVFEADLREVRQGRAVRILHASPNCTHFSVATRPFQMHEMVRSEA